jgi:hypothetical protein
MARGRPGLVIVLILLLLGLVLVLLVRGAGGLTSLLRRDEPGLPVDLVRVIPREWRVEPGAPVQCSFDDDDDLEWLVQYRYDLASLPPVFGPAQQPIEIGPRGAAIFDLQAERIGELPANPGPYRPSELVPYQLLPDFYAGKGQGYLGETSIEIFFVPNVPPGPTCQAQEINILGFGNAGLPTRISIFRWGGRSAGYLAAHLSGSARVLVDPRADTGRILRVTTFDRIDNHRSLLCQVDTYERFGSEQALDFVRAEGLRTIDFCYGPPPDPFYPEGAVVGVLRKHLPAITAPNVPPMSSYLFDNAQLPAEPDLRSPAREPIPIIRVRNPSSIQPAVEQGDWCTPEQISGVQERTWWCGRERTRIITEIMLEGVVRRAEFTVASVVPASSSSDGHWRIEAVSLEQP